MAANLTRSLFRSLSGLRAGFHRIASESAWLREAPESIALTSPAFGPGTDLPARCTIDGPGLFPPLRWSGVPGSAASLALLVEDADVPLPIALTHAVITGIDPRATGLDEGALPARQTGTGPNNFRAGRNALGRAGWLPPAPPPGHGPHHYVFQLFALSIKPVFEWPPGRTALLRAVRGHVLARGAIVGIYERP